MYKVPVNRYVERHGSVKLRGLRLSRGGGDYRIPRTALPLGLKYYRVTCRIYFSFRFTILAEEKLTKHRTNAYVSVRPLSHTHTPHSALSLTRSVIKASRRQVVLTIALDPVPLSPLQVDYATHALWARVRCLGQLHWPGRVGVDRSVECIAQLLECVLEWS